MASDVDVGGTGLPVEDVPESSVGVPEEHEVVFGGADVLSLGVDALDFAYRGGAEQVAVGHEDDLDRVAVGERTGGDAGPVE